MIKAHMSHGVPLMFHVSAHYYQFRRGKFNRFCFWILTFIGQIVDMFFSIVYGLLMLVVVGIIIIAIARGIGIGDLIVQVITAWRNNAS
jgi:hypothetical protein